MTKSRRRGKKYTAPYLHRAKIAKCVFARASCHTILDSFMPTCTGETVLVFLFCRSLAVFFSFAFSISLSRGIVVRFIFPWHAQLLGKETPLLSHCYFFAECFCLFARLLLFSQFRARALFLSGKDLWAKKLDVTQAYHTSLNIHVKRNKYIV